MKLLRVYPKKEEGELKLYLLDNEGQKQYLTFSYPKGSGENYIKEVESAIKNIKNGIEISPAVETFWANLLSIQAFAEQNKKEIPGSITEKFKQLASEIVALQLKETIKGFSSEQKQVKKQDKQEKQEKKQEKTQQQSPEGVGQKDKKTDSYTIEVVSLSPTQKGKFFLITGKLSGSNKEIKFYVDKEGFSEKFWNFLKDKNFNGFVLTDCKFRKVSSEGKPDRFFLSSCKVKNVETNKEYSYMESSATAKDNAETKKNNVKNEGRKGYYKNFNSNRNR